MSRYAEELSVEQLHDLMDMSDAIARHSVEEYKMLVANVMDAAFRRDTFQRLRECQLLCYDQSEKDIEQRIYTTLDDVMMEFSSATEIPPYREVVDDCWEEIKGRQGAGYAGIPFKFPTLNQYATIERGELFIFAAEAKQGKSMMLLNCAVDMLKQDLAVLYMWEDVKHEEVIRLADVVVDGRFIEREKDVNYPWCGSRNQRVIDVKRSLEERTVILHDTN